MVRIEPFLLDDEVLLGSCGSGAGLICATDRRLLRVERTVLGTQMHDLSYREISSVAVGVRVSRMMLACGLALLLLGPAVLYVAPLLLPALDPTRPLRLTTLGAQSVVAVGLLLTLAGVVLLASAALMRRCWVSLEGPFLLRDRRHRALWRFPTPTPSDARVFARLVRTRLADRRPVDEKKVLPHDSF